MELNKQFSEIVALIKQARGNAIKAVNTELINLYWNVGAYITRQLAQANWGEKTVDALARYIRNNHPELKGFNRRGVYRMKQFYETCSGRPFVSSLMTQIQLTDRESNENVSSAVTHFNLEDIRESILAKVSWTHHLILISGTASDEEREFYIRLCIRENYSVRELERQIASRDRDVKKENENPSIGILLCKGKDSEVVEYALSRSLSPTMVSDYKTQLPDKKLLKQKLHDLFKNG